MQMVKLNGETKEMVFTYVQIYKTVLGMLILIIC